MSYVLSRQDNTLKLSSRDESLHSSGNRKWLVHIKRIVAAANWILIPKKSKKELGSWVVVEWRVSSAIFGRR